jgi:hypothetical protein
MYGAAGSTEGCLAQVYSCNAASETSSETGKPADVRLARGHLIEGRLRGPLRG